MSLLCTWIVLAFALKLCCIVALARILDRRLHAPLGSLLGAWVLIQLCITAWMLAVSAFHALTGPHLWLAMACLVVVLGLSDIVDASWRNPSRVPLRFNAITGADRIAWLGIAVVFVFLLLRSLYFYDVTWDALTYELARISFWKQFHTLFIKLPTLQANIVTNEWNGELNALYYSLLAGNDQATSFGNSEVWLVAAGTYSWLAAGFGLAKKLSWVVGLLLAATPALLGLAVTVKGDLLACVALGLAVGWLLRIGASSSPPLAAVLAVGSLGLAAGAKIVVWTSVPMLLLVVAAALWRERLALRNWLLLGAASLSVFLAGVSRYIVNLFQYGYWFARIPGETPVVSPAHIPQNLLGLFRNIADIAWERPHGQVWVLSLGWGITGIALLVCLILLPFGWKRPASPTSIATCVALFAGFLAALVVLPWLPWTARYFAPWVFLLAAFATAKALKRMPDSVAIAISLSAVIIAGLHVFMISRFGEAIPAPGVAIGLQMARARTGLQRKMALHPYLLDGVGALDRLGIEEDAKSVLLFDEIGGAVYPFFGENSTNDITLTDDASNLVKLVSQKRYSLVVISGPALPTEQASVWKQLAAEGYQEVVNGEFWRIAVPGVRSTLR